MCLAKRRRKGKTRSGSLDSQSKQKKNRQRAPGSRYTRYSYRQAIERACKRAGVPKWTANQLRHSRGTDVRQKYGIEAAQVALGHAHADVTQVYAKKNMELAKRIAREMG